MPSHPAPPADRWPVAEGRCECCGRTPGVWTPGAIVSAMQRWNETHGRPPTSHDWRAASKDNPSNDVVQTIFGSFEAGRAAAGLEYLATKGEKKWLRDEVVLAVTRFAYEHGRPPRLRDWRPVTPDYPPLSVVKRMFGSWNGMLVAAGYGTNPRNPQLKSNRTYEAIAREAGRRFERDAA